MECVGPRHHSLDREILMVKTNRRDAYMKVDNEIKMELDAAIALSLLEPEVIEFIRESTEAMVLEMVKTVIRDHILDKVQSAIKTEIPIVINDLLAAGIPQKNLDTIALIIDAESDREEVADNLTRGL